jgi:hypothetical protein
MKNDEKFSKNTMPLAFSFAMGESAETKILDDTDDAKFS